MAMNTKKTGILISLFSIWVIVLVVIVFYSTSTDDEKIVGLDEYEMEYKPPMSWGNQLLSKDIIPLNYHLWLYPDLRKEVFFGNVTIRLEVLAAKKNIAVHTRGLSISQSRLMAEGALQTEIPLRNSFELPGSELWIVEPVANLEEGRYRLFFQFRGTLLSANADSQHGLYRTVYTGVGGEERIMVNSYFQPAYAREAFPCFDEPSFKATFDIELVKPSGSEYTALSNMNPIDEFVGVPFEGLTTVKFATSMPMSTYLVCLVVCDFDQRRSGVMTSEGFIPVTIFARPESIAETSLALNTAIAALNFCSSYFSTSYSLPKLDLVAVISLARDVGGMENWGLITFSENELLCNERNSSARDVLSMTKIVCHEIAHMWFGNLVTMKWWNDIWLNEGFASYMEYKAITQLHPSVWEIDDIFIIEELIPALKSDISPATHPLILPTITPLVDMFDTITYSKGASLIRMLECTIGERAFVAGIRYYLRRHKFGNVETNDLLLSFDGLSEQIQIKPFMETWILQKGYPVISVEVNEEDRTLKFSQSPFPIDPEDDEYNESDSPFGYKWEVPISFVTSLNTSYTLHVWMRKTDKSINFAYDNEESSDKLNWLKVNLHHYGYYVVNYEESMWNGLIATLEENPQILAPSDRAGLLSDAFQLARAGLVAYEVPLNMTRYLYTSGETSYTPWAVASDNLLEILNDVRETSAYELGRKYVQKLLREKTISWLVVNSKNIYESKILRLACTAGHSEILQHVFVLFKDWVSSSFLASLHPDLEDVLVDFGPKQYSSSEWSHFFDLYQKEQNNYEMGPKLIYILGRSAPPPVLLSFLELRNNNLTIQRPEYELKTLFEAAAHWNPTAYQLLWNFIRYEWKLIREHYYAKQEYSQVLELIPAISKSFYTDERLTQVNDFFDENSEVNVKLREEVERDITKRINWRKKYLTSITHWFSANL